MKFVLSDESVNSYGYKVLTSGIDLTAFKKNPVMLWAHDCSQPIGKWVNIEVQGARLLAEPQLFSGKDALIDKVRGMLDEGIINGVSIGFDALKWSDDQTVSAAKLVEASLCSVPSNSNAVRAELSRPGISKHYIGRDRLFRLQIQSPTMDLKAELLKLLELPDTTTDEDILTKIKEIIAVKDDTENKALSHCISAAIDAGKIDASEREFYLAAGRVNFDTTRQQLELLKPKQPTLSLRSFLQAGGVTTDTTGDRTGNHAPKDKSQWTLHDYRKHAPHELRKNAELYNRLIAEDAQRTI